MSTCRAAAPSRTWRAPGTTPRPCCAIWRWHVPDLARRTAALAITGQGDGTWLIDGEGEPVAPAWLWLNSRAAGIVRELDRSGVRDLVYRHTGCAMNACNQSAHLIWLKRHAPDLLGQAATAFHCKDWLYFKLTGERCTDVSEGTFTFGDFRTRRYVPELLAAFGLAEKARLLPAMVEGSRATHPLTAAAAAATGLPEGLPVVLGYLDVLSAGPRRRGLRARPGDRLLDRRLDRDAHALRRRRGRPAPRAGADRLHHAVPGAGQRDADAVQHGRHPEHRLGGRPGARGG